MIEFSASAIACLTFKSMTHFRDHDENMAIFLKKGDKKIKTEKLKGNLDLLKNP